CRPGIDQTHFDQIKSVLRAGKPAAGIIHNQPYAGQIDQPSITSKFVRQQINKNRIEFDASDISKSEQVSGKDVPSSANANDRTTSPVTNPIGEIGHVKFEKVDVRCVAAKPID